MKIAFCGFDGKMGKEVLTYLQENTTNNEYILINKDTTNILDKIKLSNLVIDFTNKDFAYSIALFCAKNKIPFISGTTGINKSLLEHLNDEFIKNSTGAYICPNFSRGMNNIFAILPFLSSFKNITIEETHNISKLDSPSGTALQLKSKINRDIKIISKRKKHYKAIHKINCSDQYEELIIIHKVHNKKAYGDLVVKAINNINSFIGLKQEII